MQVTQIAPTEFHRVPWKNGLGYTLELAVSEGGSMSAFDWRLSIATVAQDGVFSDFSGYWRNLILLSGKGIELTHSNSPTNLLRQHLDVAKFDGGETTHGRLIDGEITDFNVMVNLDKYHLNTQTFSDDISKTFDVQEIIFCYSPNEDLKLTILDETSIIPAGHLLKLTAEKAQDSNKVHCEGSGVIIIQLQRKEVK
ncbi:HutD/Ves family protein [Thalassotalea fusca]